MMDAGARRGGAGGDRAVSSGVMNVHVTVQAATHVAGGSGLVASATAVGSVKTRPVESVSTLGRLY